MSIPEKILNANKYRSTSANGILFEYVKTRIINEAASEEEDESPTII
jgi:hypothetical protein